MSAGMDDATTTEGLPELEVTETEPHEQGSDKGQHELTLMEKIRRDGDFATEQVRKRDATISEQSNRLKSLESKYSVFEPYLNMMGGSPDQLLNLAAYGSKVQEIPGLNEFVQKSIREGRVALPEPAVGNDPEDEWMDEDTKRVRDEARAETQMLKAQIEELKSSVNSASLRSQEVHVRGNIESAVNDFKDIPEAMEEAMNLIQSRVEVAQRQAMAGDQMQAKLVEQLAGPEGEKILSFMVHEAGLFRKYGPQIFAAKNTQTDQAAAALGKSTDAQVRNSARPGAPTFTRPEKGSAGTGAVFMSVLNQVRKANGRSAV